MIDSIAKITLYVGDQGEAKRFWTEKMGFVVRLEAPMGPGMTWLEVAPREGEGTAFVLYDKKLMEQQNPGVSVGHPSVILTTRSIREAHSELKEKGVETGELMEMPYGAMFQFYDMDGNPFLLREEK